jgi:exopolysaccharide/PEP-CTERM locus tyrosine autokinase
MKCFICGNILSNDLDKCERCGSVQIYAGSNKIKMRCPNCGYVSFNNLDKCKKCGYRQKILKDKNVPQKTDLKMYKKLSFNIKKSFTKRLSKKKHQKEITNQFNNHLISFWEPYSIAAEQYRILRTNILERYRKNESRVFLITSAVHGEGKTLTSINLAISFAIGMHESALLLDADFRRPSIAYMCGIRKKTSGLAEYIAKGSDLADFIIKTSIPKFNIIPTVNPPNNPSELINSKRMSDLINELKDRYNNRFIIIDSPPLIPVTDSTILSSLVDGIIIVIKSSATPRELVNECLNKIGEKEKIVGLVINNCDHSFFKYYNSYYKYYSRNIS